MTVVPMTGSSRWWKYGCLLSGTLSYNSFNIISGFRPSLTFTMKDIEWGLVVIRVSSGWLSSRVTWNIKHVKIQKIIHFLCFVDVSFLVLIQKDCKIQWSGRWKIFTRSCNRIFVAVVFSLFVVASCIGSCWRCNQEIIDDLVMLVMIGLLPHDPDD